MEEIKKLAEMIKKADGATVFFGGAGVSTESGIPDFRSANGIYSEQYGTLSPEAIVSGSFFKRDPKLFYSFYREKLLYPNARPGKAHISLARLEKAGLLSAVITQNIDGLHTEAGSSNVIELHGSTLRNYCVSCGRKYGIDAVLDSDGIPRCSCGGIIRPDATLFDEALPYGAMDRAADYVSAAKLLIVGGTSLAVYPAASLLHYCSGDICIINLSATGSDRYASLTIHSPIGEVLSKVCEALEI